jgi:predicted nucleotidyltransferase
MSSATATQPDTVLEAYVVDVLDAIEEAGGAGVVAAYLVGSAATGDFDARTSDVDVVVVVDRPLTGVARQRLVESAGRLGCPFRALELVIYVEGAEPPGFDLNLEVKDGAVERPHEEPHWFVIDAALAQEHARPFGDGDAWSAHFEPISPECLREALVQSIAWSDRMPPEDEFARLNAIRARHYLERGEWLSKREAAR